MHDILLDTNVVSELIKPKPEAAVIALLGDSVGPWLSSVTLHELVYGAERAPDPRRRAKLLAWVTQITVEFAGHTIVVDDEIAGHSGRLRALAVGLGRPTTVIDAVIAASAQLRGLTLVTRNTKDFEVFGIEVFNPWAESK